MHEGPPNIFEGKPESIPTPEGVQSVFEKLVEGGRSENIRTVRKFEDEQGLYLWDIVIHKDDGDIEYSYMRKGQYQEGKASATAIHVTFFDESGIPTGGHSVAKLIEGSWELTRSLI